MRIKSNNAEMTNLNVGTEGSGDGKASRLDIKVQFSASHTSLTQFFDFKRGQTSQVFWNENGKKFIGLEKIKLGNEFKHNTVTFGDMDGEEGGLEPMRDCTVKNITLEPMDGSTLIIALTIQVRDPSEHLTGYLMGLQKEAGELDIASDPDLFDEDDEEEEGELEEDQEEMDLDESAEDEEADGD